MALGPQATRAIFLTFKSGWNTQIQTIKSIEFYTYGRSFEQPWLRYAAWRVPVRLICQINSALGLLTTDEKGPKFGSGRIRQATMKVQKCYERAECWDDRLPNGFRTFACWIDNVWGWRWANGPIVLLQPAFLDRKWKQTGTRDYQYCISYIVWYIYIYTYIYIYVIYPQYWCSLII